MEKENQELVNRLNERMIHPEKDHDLLLEELGNIGIYFREDDEETCWYYDPHPVKPGRTKQII